MPLLVAFERFQSRVPPWRSLQFMTAPKLAHERLCGSCTNSLIAREALQKLKQWAPRWARSNKKAIPTQHGSELFYFCNTPNKKSPVLKNAPFRPRAIANIENTSATLGQKQKKNTIPAPHKIFLSTLLIHLQLPEKLNLSFLLAHVYISSYIFYIFTYVYVYLHMFCLFLYVFWNFFM